MSPVRDRRGKRGWSPRRFFSEIDDDPLEGVANLFDVAMVFAVVLILALFTALRVPGRLGARETVIVKNPAGPDMEIIRRQGIKLERLRLSAEELSGEGERLGICYRLADGEVVYVPEDPAPE